MVPFALNANRIPDNEAGAFFDKVLKTQKWPQGLWVVSPDGKTLSFHYFRVKSGEKPADAKARWARETREAVEAGLKAFGDVSPRPAKAAADPFPDRGCGCTKEGGVRLAVSVTAMRNGKKEGDPAVDSVALSDKEWASFLPGKLAAGTEWAVPEDVAKRLSPALSHMTDSIYTPRPKDVQKASLKAKVEQVENGVARVRLTGAWEAQHDRDGGDKHPIRTAATGEGVMLVDLSKNSVQSLLLVLKGTYRNFPPYDKPLATAAVVEWKAK